MKTQILEDNTAPSSPSGENESYGITSPSITLSLIILKAQSLIFRVKVWVVMEGQTRNEKENQKNTLQPGNRGWHRK